MNRLGCLTCGHALRHHASLNLVDDCAITGCTCTKYESPEGGDAVAQVPALRSGPALRGERLTQPATDTTTPTDVADERDHFQAGRHRMRDAFLAVRQGRMSWEQANDEFFDGNQQAKQAFAAALLARDIRVGDALEQLQAAQAALAEAARPRCPECQQPFTPGDTTIIAYSSSYRVHTECGDDSDRAHVNPLQAAQAENQQLRDHLREFYIAVVNAEQCGECDAQRPTNCGHEHHDQYEDAIQGTGSLLCELEHQAAFGQVDQP